MFEMLTKFMRPRLERTTFAYCAALALIASLAISSHLVVDGLVAAERQSTQVINIAGRQRMLTQQIARLTVEIQLGGTRAEVLAAAQGIRAAVVDMQSAHMLLRDGSTVQGIAPPEAAEITGIFTDAPHHLDKVVQRFWDAALDVADGAAAGAPRPEAVATVRSMSSSSLTTALESLVSALAFESRAAIDRLRLILFGLLLSMIITLVIEGLFIFRPLFARIQDAYRELEIKATTDGLTGLLNRRAFVERAEGELRRLKRRGTPACLILCDIDRFKLINDTYGHPTGDKVLVSFSETLRKALRGYDVIGRIGGEEFAVLVPDEELDNGVSIAEKVRAAIAYSVVQDGDATIDPTASFGVTDLRDADPGISTALKRADEALYAAKENGRNRVESLAPEPESAVSDQPSNVLRLDQGTGGAD